MTAQAPAPEASGCSNAECACVPFDGGPLATERMPWQLAVDSDGWPMVHNTGDVICVPDPNHHAGCAWDVARFRLISAAPDLLAALITAKREMWIGARDQWNLSDFKNWAVIQQIDAALEKATGQPR